MKTELHTNTPCKICGSNTVLIDVIDFNKSCDQNFNKKEPLSGIPVFYYGCPECNFIFTTHCDNWTQEEFLQNIYNDKYIECDPDFKEARPISTAKCYENQFPQFKKLKILDFGSGHGLFGKYLNEKGFNITSYDPFYGNNEIPKSNSFDIVITTEVLEHSHTPIETVEKCLSFLKKDEPACFIAGTLLTPVSIEQLKHNLSSYWYAGPRNGHISLFSEKTMRLLAKKYDALYSNPFFVFRGFEKKMQPKSS